MRRRTSVIVLAGAAVIALGVYAWSSPGAQPRRDQAAIAATSEAAVAGMEAAIREIEAGRQSTPLIGAPAPGGDTTVTFLARQVGGRVPRIVSDVTGWGEHTDGTFDFTAGTMTRVGRTEWYALRAAVAPRARIEYLIAYGLTDYQIDPHNPRQAAGPQFGGIKASEFVMPGYLPPPEFSDPPGPAAGIITEATVESRNGSGAWRVVVYTPPGYRKVDDSPVAVFLDLRSGQVSRVLDWLIAHRAIEPIVAVFVGPASPGEDHPTGPALGAFLTDELPAWMAPRYGTSRSAAARAILGISFGAKDAVQIAIASGGKPGGFGRLGLLIPGRRIGPADIAAFAGRRAPHLRVAILAGQYDRANIDTARRVRQALIEAGDRVDYTVVPEGHSAVTWTHHLRTVLVSLFGPARS